MLSAVLALIMVITVFAYRPVFNAFASVNQAPSTFLDFRSSVKANVTINNFTNKSIQENDNNFNYIPAYEIANLNGMHHNVSLRDMNFVIRTAPRSDKVGLTVFASGQEGSSSQWRTGTGSLLNVLAQKAHADVYVARTTFFTGDISGLTWTNWLNLNLSISSGAI